MQEKTLNPKHDRILVGSTGFRACAPFVLDVDMMSAFDQSMLGLTRLVKQLKLFVDVGATG
jgi:hypothetical protein